MNKVLEELKLDVERRKARIANASNATSSTHDMGVINFTFEDITPSARRHLDEANAFVLHPLQLLSEGAILQLADELKKKSATEQLALIMRTKNHITGSNLSDELVTRCTARTRFEPIVRQRQILDGNYLELRDLVTNSLLPVLEGEMSVDIDFVKGWYTNDDQFTDVNTSVTASGHTFSNDNQHALYIVGDSRMYALFVQLDDDSFAAAWRNLWTYVKEWEKRGNMSQLAQKRVYQANAIVNDALMVSWELGLTQTKSEREATWSNAHQLRMDQKDKEKEYIKRKQEIEKRNQAFNDILESNEEQWSLINKRPDSIVGHVDVDIQALILLPLQELRAKTKTGFWNLLQFRTLEKRILQAAIYKLYQMNRINKNDTTTALETASRQLREFPGFHFWKIGQEHQSYRGINMSNADAEVHGKIFIEGILRKQYRTANRHSNGPATVNPVEMSKVIQSTSKAMMQFYVQYIGESESALDQLLQTSNASFFDDVKHIINKEIVKIIPDRDEQISIAAQRYFIHALPIIMNMVSMTNLTWLTRVVAKDAMKNYESEAKKSHETLLARVAEAQRNQALTTTQISAVRAMESCGEDIMQQIQMGKDMMYSFVAYPLNNIIRTKVPLLLELGDLFADPTLTVYDVCKRCLFIAGFMFVVRKRFENANEIASGSIERGLDAE